MAVERAIVHFSGNTTYRIGRWSLFPHGTRAGRPQEVPRRLHAFGILQTDDYQGYDRNLALLHDDKQRKGNQHTNERINSEVRASEVDEEVIESVEDKVWTCPHF